MSTVPLFTVILSSSLPKKKMDLVIGLITCVEQVCCLSLRVSVSLSLSLRLSLSLCLSVSLSQTHLHVTVAMEAPPIRKKSTRYSAIRIGCSAAGRSAALDPRALKYVSVCSQLHADCTAHSLPPSSPSRAVAWCLHRLIFHKSQRQTVSRPRHIASFSPFPRLPLPLLVSTHFRCNFLRACIAR